MIMATNVDIRCWCKMVCHHKNHWQHPTTQACANQNLAYLCVSLGNPPSLVWDLSVGISKHRFILALVLNKCISTRARKEFHPKLRASTVQGPRKDCVIFKGAVKIGTPPK
jgi:hypothetical protein